MKDDDGFAYTHARSIFMQTLRISNISDECVAFKVKTTQPTWYYVRPNQHVVEPNKTEDVVIVLITEHCKYVHIPSFLSCFNSNNFSRFVDMSEEERTENLEKHRFLVQSTPITDHLYNKILNLPPNGRADEFQKLWESSTKDSKINHKLKVEFLMSDGTATEDNVQQTPTVAENVETVRNRIAAMENDAENKSAHAGDLAANPDAIVAELQSLRKKYDAVVEYTVHLTAERDYHYAQLEEVRREYAREKSRRKSSNESSGGNNLKQRGTEKGGGANSDAQQGFSLLTVIIVAVLAFVLARYTSGSGGNEL